MLLFDTPRRLACGAVLRCLPFGCVIFPTLCWCFSCLFFSLVAAVLWVGFWCGCVLPFSCIFPASLARFLHVIGVCGVGVGAPLPPCFLCLRSFGLAPFGWAFSEVLVMLVWGRSCWCGRLVGLLVWFVSRVSHLSAPFGLWLSPAVWVGSLSSFPVPRGLCVFFPLSSVAGRRRWFVAGVASFSQRGFGPSARGWFWPALLVLSVLCLVMSSVAFPAWVVSWVCVVVAGAVALSL